MQVTQPEQPGKGQGIDDAVLQALLKMSEQNQPLNVPESSASQFKGRILQGREDLKKQEAISAYLQRLGLIQKGLIERQEGLKPDEYFLEGLKQVIGEPIGAALIQDLLEDFPLPQAAATREQTTRQQTRLVAQPGTKSPEEWVAFQTLTVLGAFNLDQAGKIVKPDPKNLGPAYSVYRQGNNRGTIVSVLRPTITRALPK